MRPILLSRSLLGAGALVSATLAIVPAFTRETEKPQGRAVSYLRDVRPILTQHCFQCHGPDEAARKARLRLDLKDGAFAERDGFHVIAPGNLAGSLAWQRISTDEAGKRMPPQGKAEPLTQKQIATLKAWIEQGAPWQDHWSFVPPIKPPLPKVADAGWVRDPLDAFVLARLERERLKPEPEASREAWLRRASFDLTGLPPTPAEINDFLKDKRPDAYERQVDRLLASPRYGERQAQEWLDLARYADTSGYQNDMPRKVWKWREWVINAYNANMPFDQFTVEQLAGDLLPNATLMQKVATGFNRNHPTNSEAGEEEDEYRSAYVIDRVNTTATVFMGLTLACAQCHDHKYDPISQRDFYSFYSFFNNIKERDADFGNARPTMPVPNPDQEPRLADLKARIAALKERLQRDDALVDAAQKEWERRTLDRLGKPIEWTMVRPMALLSRNGSQLKQLDDYSILAAGPPPVKDTYDVMLLPGKKRITALRLEVLPDDSQPQKALGRSSDGRFNLSAIEIRHTTLADSQDPPLVYLSRAEADLNQKPKEDPAAYDQFPGSIESAVVVEPVGESRGGRGGWSIVNDERKKPHEAVLVPLEPIQTNDVSVLRISLHQLRGAMFKSLIGRFRISYTQDERIREQLLPAQTKLWSSIGPFAAEDVTKAFTTAFELEKDIQHEPLDLKKSYTKVVPPPPPPKQPEGGKPEDKKAEDKKPEAKPAPMPKADAPKPEAAKPAAEAPKPKLKPEKITWTEHRTWRDGSPAQLQGVNSASYLTRKVVSTRPRTALVQIDGLAGFKLWLNGEVVQTAEPPPPAPAKPEANKAQAAPDFDNLDFDIIMGRLRNKAEKKFRIGLRQGENEIVLKVVFGAAGNRPGGNGFTFHLAPEGDDVVTHEVATAIRLEALERSRTIAQAPPAGTPVEKSATDARRPREPGVTVAPEEPKKVSLVGEKSAPLKSYEEENKLSPSQRRQKVLKEYYRSHIDPIGRVLTEELDKLKEEENQVKRQIPETLVMEELDKPRQAYIFRRGLYKNRGENVSSATPAVLPPLARDLPRNRLGLAQWLVSGRHPLTARVVVNRIWQQYFGIGIVRTAEDFGIRGEAPTHPELLNYLAVELVDSKWDLKKLHKRIVLSATYRQASAATKEKRDCDPENRFLARGPRLRLTAEMVRDNALAIAGLLFEKLGGESVKPVQPENAWNTVGGPMMGAYRRDHDEKQYRRSLYVYWKRGSPYPSLLNFDAVKRDTCTVTRATTTTPLQALTLLNDPVYLECAKMLGQRMFKDRARDPNRPDDDARRLAYGFRLCTSRPPTEQETQVLKKLLVDQRAHFKADSAAAKKLLGVGDAKIDEALDPVEMAAWASVGNALLNLDATIHR
jgi:mono/diheme cytochrome c family protein